MGVGAHSSGNPPPPEELRTTYPELVLVVFRKQFPVRISYTGLSVKCGNERITNGQQCRGLPLSLPTGGAREPPVVLQGNTLPRLDVLLKFFRSSCKSCVTDVCYVLLYIRIVFSLRFKIQWSYFPPMQYEEETILGGKTCLRTGGGAVFVAF